MLNIIKSLLNDKKLENLLAAQYTKKLEKLKSRSEDGKAITVRNDNADL
jgi:hypothetical protein